MTHEQIEHLITRATAAALANPRPGVKGGFVLDLGGDVTLTVTRYSSYLARPGQSHELNLTPRTVRELFDQAEQTWIASALAAPDGTSSPSGATAIDGEEAARDVLYRLVVELGLFSSAHAFEDRVWGAARAPASVDEVLAWVLHAVRDGVLDRGNAGWVRERVLAETPDWRLPDKEPNDRP